MKNYPALLAKIKSPKYLSKKTKDERTPVKAILDSFKTIPDSSWKDPTKYWADFACGRGTIVLELINQLRRFGHSNSHIAKHIYALDINPEFSNYTTRKIMEDELGTSDLNIICADFETWPAPKDKKFNIIFNPAWNKTNVSTGNGTGGDVSYWKTHYAKAKELTDQHLVIFCMKTLLKTVREEDDMDPIAIHLMTDDNYWKANGCWVSLMNRKKIPNLNLDSIILDKNAISKVISCDRDNPNWFELNGRLNENKVCSTDGGVTAIVSLPSKNNKLIYGNINSNYSKLSNKGPKFVSSLLTNEHTYFVTEDYVCASFMGVYYTSTIEEAKKIELFVRNNELLNAIHKKLRTKGLSWTLKFIKPFDPNQIVSGKEIPVEWNLHEDEINVLLDPSYGNWLSPG